MAFARKQLFILPKSFESWLCSLHPIEIEAFKKADVANLFFIVFLFSDVAKSLVNMFHVRTKLLKFR